MHLINYLYIDTYSDAVTAKFSPLETSYKSLILIGFSAAGAGIG